MSFFQSINSRTMRTFRHKPSGNNQSRGSVAHYRLRQYAEATLGSGSLKAAVKLPEGEEVTEWVAVHTVDFYNQLNMLYSSITEFCSPTTCPEMKATDEYEYLWQDNDKFKKPTKLPAPEYIENLMIWIQSLFDNEAIFPTKVGVPFPRNFMSTIKTVFKRLYRIYAHIYCHHFEIITELGLQPHLNTSFKHFVLFAKEFDLISPKDYGPLADLSEIMIQDDGSTSPKPSE